MGLNIVNQLKMLIILILLILVIQLKKTDCNTEINEIKKKVTDHNHDKYITTQVLTSENFPSGLAQENLTSKTDISNFVKKTDFDDKLKK